jgi:hypothetical protein
LPSSLCRLIPEKEQEEGGEDRENVMTILIRIMIIV